MKGISGGAGMSVIRVNKTRDYTVMSNYHLKDKRLSLKAKGLLSLMLSLSDEWSYSIAGLVAISKENETAIKSTLKELKGCGYLTVTKKMPNETDSGRIEYEYNIYELPQEKQEVENLGVENQVQLNTKKATTKKKESKKDEDRRSYEDIINSLVDDPKVKEALQIYLQMRVMQKKAPTNNALILLVERLKELSQKAEEQVAIINQSTRGGYTDFYSLKKQKVSEGKKTKPKRYAISEPIDYSGHWKTEDGTYDLSRYASGEPVRTY